MIYLIRAVHSVELHYYNCCLVRCHTVITMVKSGELPSNFDVAIVKFDMRLSDIRIDYPY